MFCLSSMLEINLDKNDRYKKAFRGVGISCRAGLYMGFLVSLLSDRLLHLISFCRPLLRGGVLVLGLVLSPISSSPASH